MPGIGVCLTAFAYATHRSGCSSCFRIYCHHQPHPNTSAPISNLPHRIADHSWRHHHALALGTFHVLGQRFEIICNPLHLFWAASVSDSESHYQMDDELSCPAAFLGHSFPCRVLGVVNN